MYSIFKEAGTLDKDKLLPISIIILTLGIVISSFWIGYSLQKSKNTILQTTTEDSNNILNITQAAEYLHMSEKQVQGIIITEKSILDSYGRYEGMRLPYFMVDNKQYFYKEQLDQWLKETSTLHKKFNTATYHLE